MSTTRENVEALAAAEPVPMLPPDPEDMPSINNPTIVDAGGFGYIDDDGDGVPDDLNGDGLADSPHD